MGKRAIVAGATGLVGSALIELLCTDIEYNSILVLGRSKPVLDNPKISFLETNFSGHDLFSEEINGDVFFCCLGTTMKKAGSKEAFREVDFEIPLRLAQLTKEKNIPVFAVVSSLGAHSDSRNFYLRTKGQMEQEILNLGIQKVIIARPSMLYGKRGEKRIGESIGKIMMKLIDWSFFGKLRKYKGINGRTVAAALVELVSQLREETVFDSDQLALYGKLKLNTTNE